MKRLILAFTLLISSAQAEYATDENREKQYIEDSQIEIDFHIKASNGKRFRVDSIHSDEDGYYILDSEMQEIVTLIPKKHQGDRPGSWCTSWCGRCGDSFDNRWERNRHIDDFKCERGPQGCARR